MAKRIMKYTPETVQRITAAITELKGRVQASKEAGISYDTFCRWMKEKSDFSEAIKKAEDQARVSGKEFAIMCIFKAMQEGKWQAAAWLLERKFKEEYALRQEMTFDPKTITPPKIIWNDEKKEAGNG